MAIPDLSCLADWVVVFDLDDTLYQEDEYNLSGVIAVADNLEKLYSKNVTEELMVIREQKGDIWGSACDLLGVPMSVKESLLWMYRMHEPVIKLEQKIETVVKEISAAVYQAAILTDGRSITQRMKLNALGLLEYPLYISEEHSSNKPEEKRFRKIMDDFVVPNYAYVADNPSKDFIAPNSLGWETIGVLGSEKNIHIQQNNLDEQSNPTIWVNSIEEIANLELIHDKLDLQNN